MPKQLFDSCLSRLPSRLVECSSPSVRLHRALLPQILKPGCCFRLICIDFTTICLAHQKLSNVHVTSYARAFLMCFPPTGFNIMSTPVLLVCAGCRRGQYLVSDSSVTNGGFKCVPCPVSTLWSCSGGSSETTWIVHEQAKGCLFPIASHIKQQGHHVCLLD